VQSALPQQEDGSAKDIEQEWADLVMGEPAGDPPAGCKPGLGKRPDDGSHGDGQGQSRMVFGVCAVPQVHFCPK
jgi:hypothetical protein